MKYCDQLKKASSILIVIFCVLFIAAPMVFTFISFARSYLKMSPNFFSNFNIDLIIIISSLISLITNNWVKSGDTREKEKILQQISRYTFIIVILSMLITSFIMMVMARLKGDNFFAGLNLLVTFIVFCGLLYEKDIKEKFNTSPNLLYASLWGILLLTYIIYVLLPKICKAAH